MRNNINPFFVCDGYKVSHRQMYPKGTTKVYSNFTPRHGKHSNVKGSKGVISFGQQMVMRQIKEMFDEGFFKTEDWKALVNKEITSYTCYTEQMAKDEIKNPIIEEIKKEYSLYLGVDYDTSHIEALWDLGYLPIKVKAIEEGTFVPYGVPVLTIVNTHPDFFWLTNFLETMISNMLWMPMTTATTAHAYRETLIKACLQTDAKAIDFVDFQGHNFGMRGMAGLDATIYSGLGHATSFKGDDSLPTISAARKYYDENGFVVGSVNATEHSIMCAGGDEDEIGTFRYLMEQFPTGILSIVSDTWNLWDVLTKYLPELKEEILARDGKIVIRPDSGDPVDIICGLNSNEKHIADPTCNTYEQCGVEYKKVYSKNEYKGVIELLWDLFGGTINEQGYKVLDPHIGAIYGDSITLERAEQITERLKVKGFASTNVVLGIGSYSYQYVTRDTHGFAMKATYVEINGEGKNIFKDPITDDGTKKSAKGLLAVSYDDNMEMCLIDEVSWGYENTGELKVIYEDGTFYNQTTLTEIRKRLQ